MTETTENNIAIAVQEVRELHEQDEKSGYTSLTDKIDKENTILMYDATARQRMDFDAFGDDLIISAVIEPVTDAAYLSTYNRRAGTKITDNGQSAISDSAEGLAALFDEVVSDIEGIPGEKPENWKSLLDAERVKIPVMGRFLSVACYDEGLTWGQTEKAVISESYFNNEIVEGRHFLRKKTPEDVRFYRNFQKIPIVNKGKGLNVAEIIMPTFADKKAKLYDQMQEKTAEGYQNGIVPIWHKVAVVDFVFSAGVTAKK